MFGSILLRLGTYLVETFIGTGAVKDGGTRLENVKNAIETKINDFKKTTEIGNIKNTLADILEADDKTVRSEKVDAVIKQIDKINLGVTTPEVAETNNSESISNKLLKTIAETSFYKLVLGGFLAFLLICPTWIKSSIKDSELGRVFRSGLSTVSDHFIGLEIGNVKLSFAKNKLPAIANDLKAIKEGAEKTNNLELENQLQQVIDQIENTDKVLKSQLPPTDGNSGNPQKDGWIYLGKVQKDNKTWEKAETISGTVNLQDLTVNSKVTITDSVNLRTERLNCERSSGDFISTIPVGTTITIVENPSICPDTKTVWAKVRRN